VIGEARRLSGADSFTREDLAQEGIIAVLHALDAYDPERGSIEGYVRACARNRMISYLRHNRQESPMDEDLLNAKVSDDAAADVGNVQQERIEIDEALSKLLKCLSPFEKSVLHAYLREGSLSKVAQSLVCDRKKVDNALQRIRNKARTK
jgi:RNA polymerase sigma factor (sigma-70 family)